LFILKPIIITTLLFLSGCSTNKVVFSVQSSPSNAQIDVNGKEKGVTPTKISLECSKEWVGIMVTPTGWLRTSDLYEIKVHPPLGHHGQSQSQFIDPCKWSGKYQPTLNYEFSIITSKDNLTESIRSLKILRDQNILTEKEYKQKLLQLVE
jgi:hypothetical protein